jgi:hypothetical protein
VSSPDSTDEASTSQVSGVGLADAPRTPPPTAGRALVAGWFSFPLGHATAGDLLAGTLAREWLERAGMPCDMALAPQLGRGVDWRSTDPRRYSHVVFVCGPFADGEPERAFLGLFAGRYTVGLDLSMEASLDKWQPFDLLLERDSDSNCRPDIVFAAPFTRVPVVGIVLVEPHAGASCETADALINRLVASRQLSAVEIDTRLDVNRVGLRTPGEVESLIARMDLVLTTRLHGLVLALKNGVPAVAIDPIPGGAKIRRQAEAIGWPVVFNVDDVTDQGMNDALDYCLTAEARAKAVECSDRARKSIAKTRAALLSALTEQSS